MKKLLYLILLVSVTMSTFGAIPVRALSLTDTGIYTFSNLGVNADLVFNGPYDANTIRFGLPPTWQLQDGAELDLSISSYFTANNVPSADNSSFSGALLNVYFNDKLQQSIPLVSGKAVNYQIPISSDALNSPDSSGRHKISFFLDASIDCRLDFHKTTVIVSSTSKILFPHADKALSLDLRRLPWPIYQDNNVEKVSAVVVVPETASADELQAGLVAAGAFGRMTGGKLPLTLISNDQLTDAIKSQSNIILVGKPSAFPELGGAAMTVPIVGGKYVLPDLKDDDGILQVVVSPWNSSNVLLAVSGNTDQGVVKAAQALSTSNIQTADAPNYSIISTVNPIATTGTLTSRLTPIPSSDASLSDLGYEAINSSGIGSNWMSVEFDVPSGQAPADGAYIDLKYSTSALTDVNRSSGDIYLNNVLIGSLNFSSTDSNIITSRINLPMSILRSGTNNLDINVNLLPKDSCSVFAFSGLWITIFPDSILHLPLTPAQSASVSLQGIKLYPFPFANDSALSTTAFIVSKQDRASWSAAGRISYDLGTKISGSIIGFEAAYSDQVPDDIRTHNLIVIGEPKNLNVISDFKNTLPAYFEANSNIAVLNSLQVIYRFSGSKKLGYLELFPSPWNQTGTALGIFGTSSEGIGFAVDAILNAASRDALVGNFAVLDGNKAVVADTRTGLGLGQIESNLDSAVISTAAVPIVEPSNINQAQSEAVQNRLLIAVGVIGIVILIIAVVVFTLWRGKRKV